MKYNPIIASRAMTISSSEFKAKCLDILARLASGQLQHVTVTRHGKPVAELTPPRADRAEVESLFGFMRGSVRIPDGLDLTQPVIDMDGWQPELPH